MYQQHASLSGLYTIVTGFAADMLCAQQRSHTVLETFNWRLQQAWPPGRAAVCDNHTL
jgi:hypothetical protein